MLRVFWTHSPSDHKEAIFAPLRRVCDDGVKKSFEFLILKKQREIASLSPEDGPIHTLRMVLIKT